MALPASGRSNRDDASTAVGDSHPSLGATGQHAVGWCIDGLSDDEILARMGKGEAAYKLEGGFY